jgi:hypothetical protein
MTQFNQAYRKCIEACQECILRCEECIKGMATEASDNDCPVCCHECLQLCQLCISAMARDSRIPAHCALRCANGARSSVAFTAMTTAGDAPSPAVSAPPSAARLLRENAAVSSCLQD